MATNVSNTSSVSATTGLSKATSAPGQISAQEQSDRFMKLLVAQLKNQDPMNPMDNAQMTSQMAQINTVSGIQQLNETVQSLAGQFNAMQALQGTSLIGHDVLTTGNSMKVDAATGMAKAAFDLSGKADAVSVQVLSPGGQLLDTLSLGAMGEGQHEFQWDASQYTGSGSPTFKVSATAGDKNVAATAFARDTISSVGNTSTGMTVQLKGGASIAYNAIQSIL